MKAFATLTLAALIATGALAAGATAADYPSEPTAIERLVRQEDARRNDLQLGITRPTSVVPAPAAPTIKVVVRDTFDWLDAAIGAGTAIIAALAIGGALVAVGARAPRPV